MTTACASLLGAGPQMANAFTPSQPSFASYHRNDANRSLPASREATSATSGEPGSRQAGKRRPGSGATASSCITTAAPEPGSNAPTSQQSERDQSTAFASASRSEERRVGK